MKGRYKKPFVQWCPNCDRSLVEEGQKCHVCGVRRKGRKDRPSQNDLLKIVTEEDGSVEERK